MNIKDINWMNQIWLAIRNPDDEVLYVGNDFKTVDREGRAKLKKGETFYLRTVSDLLERYDLQYVRYDDGDYVSTTRDLVDTVNMSIKYLNSKRKNV